MGQSVASGTDGFIIPAHLLSSLAGTGLLLVGQDGQRIIRRGEGGSLRKSSSPPPKWGHLLLQPAGGGDHLRNRQLFDVCDSGITAVTHLYDSIVSLDEWGFRNGLHLFDFVKKREICTLGKAKIRRGRGRRKKKNDMQNGFGSCFMKRHSLLIGKGNLQVWRINRDHPSNSVFVGLLKQPEQEQQESFSSSVVSSSSVFSVTCGEKLTEPSNWVLSGDAQNLGQVWDVQKMVSVGQLRGHEGAVHGIQLMNDAIATCSWDRTVRLWDKQTLEQAGQLLTFDEQLCSLLCVDRRSTGEGLILVGGERNIHVIDPRRFDVCLETWDSLNSQGFYSIVAVGNNRVAFSSFGSEEAGHGICAVWNLDNGKKVLQTDLIGRSWSLCFVPSLDVDDPLSPDSIIPAVSEDFGIDPGLVTCHEMIRKGGEGIVYRGTYRCVPGKPDVELKVAIKRFPVALSEEVAAKLRLKCDWKKLKHEIRLMSEMLRHENVLKCFGMFIEEDPHAPEQTVMANVVFEFCEGGDLRDWLKLHKDHLSPQRKVSILREVAAGLAHLHEGGIIHLDVSLGNVLVTSKSRETAVMRLGDFGLSKHAKTVRSQVFTGKPRYMPPSRKGEKTKIDVYGFGILAWEIWNEGTLAYSDRLNSNLDPLSFLSYVQMYHLRPDIGTCAGMLPEIRDLVVSCWHDDPSERPPFSEIVTQLAEAADRMESGGEEEEEVIPQGEDKEEEEEGEVVEEGRSDEEPTEEVENGRDANSCVRDSPEVISLRKANRELMEKTEALMEEVKRLKRVIVELSGGGGKEEE